MNNKYMFTDETRNMVSHKLHRIRALKDVGVYAKTGVLGGWIESEGTWLPQETPGLLVRLRCMERRRYLVMRSYSEARL